MIIGVDQGYTWTKNSKGDMFPSRVRQGETIDINKVLQVNINGVQYIIGEKDASYTVDTNKVDDEKTRICILTSTAMAAKDDYTETQIVTGLPPGHYVKQKDQLKEMLLSRDLTKIIIGGHKKTIRIKKVEVFIQGAGPVFINPMRFAKAKVLTIDIGGLTVDTCYFDNMKLEKFRTYEKGMLKLYSQLISEVNSKLELNYDITDGDSILRNGVKIYGKPQDLSFLKPVKESYINGFMTDIKVDFPIKTMDYILLMGGGAEGLKEQLLRMIHNAEVTPQSQLSNAICYEQIGRVRFNG